MPRLSPVPVISLVGTSGSGKTTLVEQLLPHLLAAGLTVGTAKHHHGSPALDIPGKDSARHAGAGAAVVALSGAGGMAIFVRETRPAPETRTRRAARAPRAAREPALREVVARAHAASSPAPDLILAEGFSGDARTAIRLRDARGTLRPIPRTCEVLAELDLHAAPARSATPVADAARNTATRAATHAAARPPRFPAHTIADLATRILAWLAAERRRTARTVRVHVNAPAPARNPTRHADTAPARSPMRHADTAPAPAPRTISRATSRTPPRLRAALRALVDALADFPGAVTISVEKPS